MSVEAQFREIMKGVQEVLPDPEALKTKLEKAAAAKRPLRVKLGIDPSGTDIHLGHTVTLWKLRQFQDLGHQAVLIIGDYTAMLGDPSGRNAVRPQLTHEQVMANAESYQAQIARIVDLEAAEIRPNGTWFTKFDLKDVIRLGATTTLMRMLERKDFKERVETQQPLYIHELLYPLMQGWDSVEVEADIELGGSDQIFNILKGRDLMAMEGQDPQVGVILPLLLGTDGTLKMGKSTGNYIGLNEPPQEMYGKVMSIPDELIVNYWALAIPSTSDGVERVQRGLEDGTLHPMKAKLELAHRITAQYHNVAAAERAAAHFQRVVREGSAPKEVPELVVAAEGALSALDLVEASGTLGKPLSRSECKRLIKGGAVRLDDDRLTDPFADVNPATGSLLQVGKRTYFRIVRG
jgi:tyrosyl-tRNA synthetase